jgi:hypothetical protein
MKPTDKLSMALASFKDWSNYLLLATVAAIGWLGTSNSRVIIPESYADTSLVLQAISLVFAMLTLAAIPVIGEQITEDTESFLPGQVSALRCFGRRACAEEPGPPGFLNSHLLALPASASIFPPWLRNIHGRRRHCLTTRQGEGTACGTLEAAP